MKVTSTNFVCGAVTERDTMHLLWKPGLLGSLFGSPSSLCGKKMGVYGKPFNYIGQVACKDCRREYARLQGHNVGW